MNTTHTKSDSDKLSPHTHSPLELLKNGQVPPHTLTKLLALPPVTFMGYQTGQIPCNIQKNFIDLGLKNTTDPSAQEALRNARLQIKGAAKFYGRIGACVATACYLSFVTANNDSVPINTCLAVLGSSAVGLGIGHRLTRKLTIPMPTNNLNSVVEETAIKIKTVRVAGVLLSGISCGALYLKGRNHQPKLDWC